MERDKLEAMDKMVRPPIVAPTDMLTRGGVNIVAGGVTFLDTSRPGATVGPMYQVNPNLAQIGAEIARVEDRIRSAFYSNLFLSIIAEGKQMTAREVAERSQEKMMMLGPVIPVSWRLDAAPALMFTGLVVIAIDRSPALVAATVGGSVAYLGINLPERLGIVAGAVAGVAAGGVAEMIAMRRGER
jgi:hypothetical protein